MVAEEKFDPKITQGQIKVLRLIDDLIRNDIFLKSLRKIIDIKDDCKRKENTNTWTPEERKRNNYLKDERKKIVNEYERVKKRANKFIYSNQEVLIKDEIAWKYGVDSQLVNLAIATYKKDELTISNYLQYGEVDMCRFYDDNHNEMVASTTKGADWIKLQPSKQTELIAYPFSVRIHRNASQRDIIDFIEKTWWYIEMQMAGLNEKDEKTYRARRRKHDQKMLDFIWENHLVSSKKIKEKIDIEFPNHGLVYYEIDKIIQQERKKRLENFEI